MEGNTFAVMLLPVPSLPCDGEGSPWVLMQALIGCTDFESEGKYSWVELSPSEKQVIGDKLNNQGAEENTWYWCELFERADT
jgi:hypothetical protein